MNGLRSPSCFKELLRMYETNGENLEGKIVPNEEKEIGELKRKLSLLI